MNNPILVLILEISVLTKASDSFWNTMATVSDEWQKYVDIWIYRTMVRWQMNKELVE